MFHKFLVNWYSWVNILLIKMATKAKMDLEIFMISTNLCKKWSQRPPYKTGLKFPFLDPLCRKI